MKNLLKISLPAALLLFGCTKKQEEPIANTPFEISDVMLKSTSFATVEEEPLKNELRFFGKISANQNKLIEVYPVVGGNVEQVFVSTGDHVKKGQVLASIRSTEVAGIEKDFQDAKNEAAVAQKALKMAQEMYEGKLTTEKDVLEARSNLEKANSQVARLQQVYKIYNLKPGSIFQVTAPLDGYIVQKNINQDMQLRSDRTDNIFDIADTRDVWAIANVNEGDINQVQLGMEAAVSTLSNPDKVFRGKVDKIVKFIDPETNAMNVRVVLNNDNMLLVPDSKATIRLFYNEGRTMTAVPSSAIIFDNNRNFVMVYKDRKHLETRQVEVFREVGGTTYIKSGLAAGEKVVSKNQLYFYDALND